MTDNQFDSIDPILSEMFTDLRAVPPRDPQNAASGRANYLAEVDSLLADPRIVKQAGTKTGIAERINLFKYSFGQRAALTAIVAVVAILVFLFGSAGMTAYAAQSALPGDALYPVKTQLERTQASLSADASREAQLYLRFAQRRLDEIASLIAQGRFDDITAATNEFQAYIQKALDALQQVAVQDPQAAAQLSAEITSQLTRYAQTLAGMMANVPGSAQEQLERAIQASQQASRLETSPDGDVEIVGVIDEIGDGWIRIGGRMILVTPQTVIDGDLLVGSLVKVRLVLVAGKLAASRIQPAESPAVNENGNTMATPMATKMPMAMRMTTITAMPTKMRMVTAMPTGTAIPTTILATITTTTTTITATATTTTVTMTPTATTTAATTTATMTAATITAMITTTATTTATTTEETITATITTTAATTITATTAAAMTTATPTTEAAPAAGRFSALMAKPAWQAAVQAAVLLAIFIAFLALVQFATPNMPDNDGYYHIKLAYLMRTESLKPDFPWLPLSILNPGEYSDHHFLFHVGLIPFTFGDLRLGAKWAAVVFSSLAFLSVWWLFYRQRIPYAALWSLGLLVVSEAFIYRMSITRAQSLSLAFLALGLSLILHKNYRWLLALSFLYVWLYDAFPLILFVAGAYTLAVLLLERRLELCPIFYAGIGLGLGVLINPYFPDNLVFLIRHLLPKLTEATAVSVGSEWYPYDTTQLLSNSPLALVAFVAGVLALGLQERRMDVRTAASLFLAVLFGLMLFQSRRFIEYFPAFALIFCAFAWTPLIEAWQTKLIPAKAEGASRQRIWPGWLPAALLLLVLVPGAWLGLRDSQKSIRTSKPYNLYAGASAWLQANTPAGERVFQTDWDDFPRLFFYNTHNSYLIGLDPTYMQLYNPELYARWVDITKGRVSDPSKEIFERFASRYILTDLQHKAFIDQAEDDPGLKQVYRDGQAIIYQVLD